MTLANNHHSKGLIVTTSSASSSTTATTTTTASATTSDDYRPETILSNGRKTTKTKRLVLQISLFGLTIVSILANYALIYVDIIDYLVLYNMCLRNSTDAFEYWKEPPVKPLLKVYIFNYTNVERYHKHLDATLKISEIGPFVYEEHLERINIKINENQNGDWNDNNDDQTISYQEKRHYRYREDLSTGVDRFASVTAPNLPMLTAVAKTSNAYFMTKLGMSAFLSGLNAEPFVNIPAHDYLWGYDDNLYRLSRNLLPAKYIGMATENFGVLAKRKGISPNKYVIKTGVRNRNEIGNLIRMNEQSFQPYWNGRQCSYGNDRNQYGSDGSKFAMDAIRRHRPVQIFSPDLCRHLQYEFQRIVYLFNDSIPALRYELSNRIFDCACDSQAYATCSPLRILNLTECARGAPTFLSFPCFRHANEALQSRFGRVCRDSDSTHKSFINIHPKYGFTMSAQNSFQINVLAKDYVGFSQMRMFHEDLILPVVYIQMEFDESTIPDNIYKIFYDLTYMIPIVNGLLKCLSILSTLVLIVMFLLLRLRP